MSNASALSERQIEIYVTDDGDVQLDVPLERETVWLSQAQLVKLFGRDVSVISRHIANVFKEKELDRKGNLQKMQIAGADRPVTFYSLDVVISVGYRVKSPRGTQFRIWANGVLRDHLLDGYTLNQRRLGQTGLADMEQAVKLLGRTLHANRLMSDQGNALLDLVSDYARTWRLLLQYDENKLPAQPKRPTKRLARLTPARARYVIATLKARLASIGEASALFGQERGHGLDGILGNIEQTFGGTPLYPSVEARAAHVLYFIIKDHPFSDGNKRIGSFLFLHYLDKNRRLLRPDGSPSVDDNALVALALLIAESNPSQKDLMIRLTMSLLDDRPSDDA
jgi:prophage maintenance system killer protein